MANENINSEILLPILKKIPLFKNLDAAIHSEIIKRIVLMYYPANYVLFKQGDDADTMYIIKTGAVEIYNEPEKEEDLLVNLADIGQGGFFGEMALVSNLKRNASARAKTDCEIFILSKKDFNQLLDSNPTMAEQISATIIARMKENDQKQQ